MVENLLAAVYRKVQKILVQPRLEDANSRTDKIYAADIFHPAVSQSAWATIEIKKPEVLDTVLQELDSYIPMHIPDISDLTLHLKAYQRMLIQVCTLDFSFPNEPSQLLLQVWIQMCCNEVNHGILCSGRQIVFF